MPKGGNGGGGAPGGGDGGTNQINGGRKDDVLHGTPGDDAILGKDGNDTLYGEAGNDFLSGGTGGDTLHGGEGSDRLFGNSGDDHLFGGDGDDELQGGSGRDTIDGGKGIDVAYYMEVPEQAGGSGITVAGTYNSGTQSTDYTVMVPEGPESVTGVEIIIGSNYNDQMTGGAGADTFAGAYGADTLEGGGGDDFLAGGGDADRFVFDDGWGNDTITDFEDGLDLLDFSESSLNFVALNIVEIAGDTVISDGFGNSITLAGIAGSAIGEDDFIFA